LAEQPGMERFLAGQMKPAERSDLRWLDRQIAGLASDDFATRQKSEKALAGVGDAAEAALRQAYQRSKDLEQRQRLGRLLDRLETPSANRLREHRAVLALEMRGTAEARRLLARLAAGRPGAQLTEEARAASRRPGRQTR